MKKIIIAGLLLMAAVQTVNAQKVVLHMAGNRTFECSISQLDSITFEETEDPAPKVRAAIYETIPGYEVQDVVFYTDALSDSPQTVFTLYAAESQSPFTIEFGTLCSNTLGTTSVNATFAGNADDNFYTTCLPDVNGTNLTLRVNYTLVASDGSGEIIHVTNASAQVPSDYTKWKIGCTYTYLFKIYGTTSWYVGQDASELFPVKLDSVIVESNSDGTSIITR